MIALLVAGSVVYLWLLYALCRAVSRLSVQMMHRRQWRLERRYPVCRDVYSSDRWVVGSLGDALSYGLSSGRLHLEDGLIAVPVYYP